MAEQAAFIKALGDRVFWNISYRHRKVLIPVLSMIILLGAFFLVQSYVSMENKLRQLSSYEPIYVLSVKRHLDVGDVIQQGDIYAKLYYKREFDKVKIPDTKSGMPDHALIPCNFDPQTQQLSGFSNIVGRVAKIPILKDSLLRKDSLANPGALPGLQNLITEGHSLLDVWVEQIGFNIFIKPGDLVDLYITVQGATKKIAKDIEVILVDSLPLGKAPFQVQVNPATRRNLTMMVPDVIYQRVLGAKRQGNLTVTYNKSAQQAKKVKRKVVAKPKKAKPKINPFQSLLLIKGSEKELLGGH